MQRRAGGLSGLRMSEERERDLAKLRLSHEQRRAGNSFQDQIRRSKTYFSFRNNATEAETEAEVTQESGDGNPTVFTLGRDISRGNRKPPGASVSFCPSASKDSNNDEEVLLDDEEMESDLEYSTDEESSEEDEEESEESYANNDAYSSGSVNKSDEDNDYEGMCSGGYYNRPVDGGVQTRPKNRRLSKDMARRPSRVSTDRRPSGVLAGRRHSRVLTDRRPSRVSTDRRPSRVSTDRRPSLGQRQRRPSYPCYHGPLIPRGTPKLGKRSKASKRLRDTDLLRLAAGTVVMLSPLTPELIR